MVVKRPKTACARVRVECILVALGRVIGRGDALEALEWI